MCFRPPDYQIRVCHPRPAVTHLMRFGIAQIDAHPGLVLGQSIICLQAVIMRPDPGDWIQPFRERGQSSRRILPEPGVRRCMQPTISDNSRLQAMAQIKYRLLADFDAAAAAFICNNLSHNLIIIQPETPILRRPSWVFTSGESRLKSSSSSSRALEAVLLSQKAHSSLR